MDIGHVIGQYLQHYPEDRPRLTLLASQLAAGEELNGRANFTGHVTAGAIVISPDREKALLVHHKFLGKWLQPGGHWDDGEADPLTAARREAVEETGVDIQVYLPLDQAMPLVPIHIETHAIPANPAKGEPSHYHHDFRYVFIAVSENVVHAEDEVSLTGWFRFDAAECDEIRDALTRMRSTLLNTPRGQNEKSTSHR